MGQNAFANRSPWSPNWWCVNRLGPSDLRASLMKGSETGHHWVPTCFEKMLSTGSGTRWEFREREKDASVLAIVGRLRLRTGFEASVPNYTRRHWCCYIMMPV